MHSTSPENEENILFWQWIVRAKILFTASKGSWSKTVWRIISAKVCEHLLNTIFSPYEWIFSGSSWWGYPLGGRNPPNIFCPVPLNLYTSSGRFLFYSWPTIWILRCFQCKNQITSLASVFHPSPTSSISSPEPVVHICVTICCDKHLLSNKLDSISDLASI